MRLNEDPFPHKPLQRAAQLLPSARLMNPWLEHWQLLGVGSAYEAKLCTM